MSLLVRLSVKPGPPASLSISGEGKAVAALKEFALGEACPRLYPLVVSEQLWLRLHLLQQRRRFISAASFFHKGAE